VNDMNFTYFTKFIRRYGGISKISTLWNHTIYDVTLCDEDAAAFLRDLPKPFIVAYILYRYSGEIFYKHSKDSERTYPASSQ
jgi:hypothetical protein